MTEEINRQEFYEDNDKAFAKSSCLRMSYSIYMSDGVLGKVKGLYISDIKDMVLDSGLFTWEQDNNFKGFISKTNPEEKFLTYESDANVVVHHNQNNKLLETCRRVTEKLNAYTIII